MFCKSEIRGSSTCSESKSSPRMLDIMQETSKENRSSTAAAHGYAIRSDVDSGACHPP